MFSMFPMMDPEAHARHQMESDQIRHDLFETLETFDKAQMDAFDRIITAIQGAGDEAALVASFWSGYLTSRRDKRFNVCPACNKDHDEELRKAMEKGDEDDDPGDRVPTPPDPDAGPTVEIEVITDPDKMREWMREHGMNVPEEPPEA